MNTVSDTQAIADQAQLLTQLCTAATQSESSGVGAIKRAQIAAMYLGAMIALAWVLGESEAPSVAIPIKAEELSGE